MPRRLRWSSLIPGVIILATLVGITIAVLMFAQVGALRGETFRLYAAAGSARGVIEGTEVWLSGQKVGLVTGIGFRSVDVDTNRRVVIGMDVLERHREQIRSNSTAQVRAGGTLIGAQVVWLASGSSDMPIVGDGDTIAALPQGDAENVSARAAMAAREFPAIINNIKLLTEQLTSSGGTLGAMGADRGGQPLVVFRERATSLTSQATSGDGSIGLALRGGDLATRARTAFARSDSIRMILADSMTSLGRFRRDSTLLRTVTDVRNEVSIVRALLDNSVGSAGRVQNDKAIARELAGIESELAALMADIQRRPLRYIAF